MARGQHRRRWPWIVRGGVLVVAAASVAVGGTLGVLEARESPEALPGRTISPSGPPAPINPRPGASVVSPAPATSAAPFGPLDVYAAISDPRLSQAVAGFPERVYVPNTVSGTVSVIDPTTYRVVETLSVGGTPHHVTPSWDMKHLYIDNAGSGILQEIDPRSGARAGSIDVRSPYNLYFTPDGTRALVVAEYDQLIEFRDPHTWKLIKALPVPGRGVDHLDFSADGTYLLVSCEYDGLVVRIDPRKMRVTGTVSVGGRPIDVKVSPDGTVFYVANQGSSGVSIIDPMKLKQIGFIPTGAGAHGMAVSRDTKDLYVSNRIAGTISVIRFATRKIVATWPVGGSPDMLQVSPDGTELWASNRFSDTVSVISTASGRVTHRIVVGSQPHGLTYFPQPGRYCLGHNGVYR